jgi:hypothetical protein
MEITELQCKYILEQVLPQFQPNPKLTNQTAQHTYDAIEKAMDILHTETINHKQS